MSTATTTSRRPLSPADFRRLQEAGIIGETLKLDDGVVCWDTGKPYGFTIEDLYAMVEAGILHEDDRVELIEGEIVQMPPIGRRHGACVDRLDRWSHRQLGDRVHVRVQGPLRIRSHTTPQPDLTLLRPREDDYESVEPGPTDAFLVIEVADTTIRQDRQVKAQLYASVAIPEYWLVDLNENIVEVYRQPRHGTYQDVQRLEPDDVLAPLAFADAKLPVRAVLGL